MDMNYNSTNLRSYSSEKGAKYRLDHNNSLIANYVIMRFQFIETSVTLTGLASTIITDKQLQVNKINSLRAQRSANVSSNELHVINSDMKG